ncbi:MAG: hypothetical protein R3F11_05185 [Verrucomicrobiales bacterium]
MKRALPLSLIVAFAAAASPAPLHAQAEIPAIPRRLPPEGKALPDAAARAALEKKLADLEAKLEEAAGNGLLPDAEIYAKAVRYALAHGEFYNKGSDKVADAALGEGIQRAEALAAGKAPWLEARGTVVRGYRSPIDGSAQPYGLEIPAGLKITPSTPIYVWLHGRGDTETDLYFIANRAKKPGQFQPGDGIVLHPFGRQCIGWKHAGELDVFDALDHVRRQFKIDSRAPVALMGFRWAAREPGTSAPTTRTAGMSCTRARALPRPPDTTG